MRVSIAPRTGGYAVPHADHPLSPRQLLVAVVLLLTGCFLAFGAERADANHVSCGDTITADSTLDSDLVNCPNHGVVIGANDITLDMNGHLIDGDRAPAVGCRPRMEPCDFGVFNDGHDGVTVRDGSVRDFATGVLVGEARHNRVLNVSSSRNQFFGFVIAESAQSVVRDSSGSDNPVPDGDGIGVFASHDLRILGNSFRRNALGMHVADSSAVLIRGNVFARNRTEDIKLEGDRNQVSGNRCARGGPCVVVHGNRNVIAGNRSLRDEGGVLIEQGRGNLVTRNVVVRARRDGIHLAFEGSGLRSGNNVIRRNVVRGSHGDAFAVASPDRRSFLGGNLAIAAGGDGFDIDSPSAKLRNNRAVRNAELGIEAVHGVFDGGGNSARHNGDPRRCTNISCR
jgi:parallel beta-helix repeat protein